MPATLRCMSCHATQNASKPLGTRVLICGSCQGLMTDETNPLTVNAAGTVSLEGRTIAIACVDCQTILDIAPEMLGQLTACPRCRREFLVPAPRPIVLTQNGGRQPTSVQGPKNAGRASKTKGELPPAKAATTSRQSTNVDANHPFSADEASSNRKNLTEPKRTFRRPDEPQWSPDLIDSPPFPSLPRNEKSASSSQPQVRESSRPNPTSSDRPSSVAADTSTETPDVTNLRRVYLFRSWKVSKVTLPHFLLRGRGRILEAILRSYIVALHREHLPGVEVAFAGELQNVPDVNRPLRVLHRIRTGHMGVTDILFRAEGNDLYVKFQSNPRTWINYLQLGVYAALFVLFYSLFLLVYLNGTGAYQGWATDYATKYARKHFAGEDCSPLYMSMITLGYYQFDNDAFVESMSDDEGKRLLKTLIDKMLGTKAGRDFVDSDDDANFALLFFADGIHKRLYYLGYDGFAYESSDKIGYGHGVNHFFVWYNPRRKIFNYDKQLYGYQRIEVLEPAKDTLRSGFLGYPELEKIPQLSKRMSEAYDRSLTFHRPWSIAKLFFSDPKLAVMSIGGPSALFGLLIGCGLYFLPLSVLSIPCRFLGWPTPDEFHNTVQSRNAWTERVLSDVLFHEFGVQEGDRFAILSQ